MAAQYISFSFNFRMLVPAIIVFTRHTNQCTRSFVQFVDILVSSLRSGMRAVPPVRSAMQSLRDLADPERRAMRHMMRHRGTHVLQPYPTTSADRYPEVFTAISAHLWEIERPTILSYGCSDGSEVRSLRRWFPQATIVGLDPNGRMIQLARAYQAIHPDPHVRFIEADSPLALGDMRFDAILAMAVFRHGDLERLQPPDCAQILPFRRFAETVTLLDQCLKPGGWLSIWNAHFRFSDTALAGSYDARSLTSTREDPLTLLYGADDRRIAGASYSDAVFRKLR